MIQRPETKYILVTATDEPLSEQEIVWRARKYGWRDAGCHYIIDREGSIHQHRAHNVVAVSGRPHNQTSVVIVLAGMAPHTAEQLTALARVVTSLELLYPGAEVVGHRDLPDVRTDAPGFDVGAWWTGLRAVNAL